MKVTVDLQIACKDSIPDKAKFQSWAEAALAEVVEDCELSIRLVEVNESTRINSIYRGIAKPTNVLSFTSDILPPIQPRLLGDLVICNTVVEAEARQQHKQSHDHWAHMVIHGCLHLLSYDHIETDEAKKMEALEVEILQSLNIDNPHPVKRTINE